MAIHHDLDRSALSDVVLKLLVEIQPRNTANVNTFSGGQIPCQKTTRSSLKMRA
jgi:hypothetical protein